MKDHPRATERALLFDWEADDRSLLRLMLAALVTLLGISALFVIFRVATPEAPRQPARSRQVLVLNPAIPAELALIHRAMDRSFPILPVESGPPQRVPAVLPRQVPSYLGHELKLKPLAADSAELSAPPLVSTSMSLLPAPASQPPPPPAAPRKQELRPIFEGPLSARAPAQVPALQVPLAEESRPVFHLIISPQGRVLHALPLIPAEDEAITQALRAAAVQWQFQPGESGSIATGQVAFRWEDAAP